MWYEVFSGLAVGQGSAPNFANRRSDLLSATFAGLKGRLSRPNVWCRTKDKRVQRYLPIRANTFEFWNAICFAYIFYSSINSVNASGTKITELKFFEQPGRKKRPNSLKLSSSLNCQGQIDYNAELCGNFSARNFISLWLMLQNRKLSSLQLCIVFQGKSWLVLFKVTDYQSVLALTKDQFCSSLNLKKRYILAKYKLFINMGHSIES